MCAKVHQADDAGRRLGKYQLHERIGKGGMGSVYRATGPDDQVVAVKVLAEGLADDRTQIARFTREAETTRRLDHANVVRVLDLGIDAGQHYFVMELVTGVDVGQYVKKNGPLDERKAIKVIVQVARGLHSAHKAGLIHRDVKPDNILLGTGGEVKLTDLGLVKQLDAEMNLTRTNHGLGTPHFMAPEQFKQAKHADVRCDVYSLGATLYAMVTGVAPFKGKNPLESYMKKASNDFVPPDQLNSSLSPQVVATILAAMDNDPARRPGSAKAFAQLLMGKIGADQAACADPPEAASVAGMPVPTTDSDPAGVAVREKPATRPGRRPRETSRYAETTEFAPSVTPPEATADQPAPEAGFSNLMLLMLVGIVVIALAGAWWMWR